MNNLFRWKRSPDPRAVLQRLIGDYEVPSFSAAAVSTLGLLRSDTDMALIADRIMADPGLSVRILRAVNSAAFGMRQQATNLVHAVTLLGRSRVESLVLTAAVRASIPTPRGMDIVGFWQTAADRACLARNIAARVHPSLESESFTAGLLQDMAVPVLAAAHPDRYAAIYQQCEPDTTGLLHEMEQEAFGYDHAQVGAMMAENWGLPEPLITAIADHHLTGQRAPCAVEAVSHIRHSEKRDDLQALRTHCRETLKLPQSDLEAMIESAGAESSSLAESMR